MELVDARTLVQSMRYVFLPKKAGDMKAVVYLNLSGPNGGKWAFNISGGECRIREGEPEKWNVQLKARDDNFVKISVGAINPIVATLTLKLITLGNPFLALRFQNCFAKPKDFSLNSLFDILPQLLKTERMGDATAAVMFDVDGPGGGQWVVRVDSGRCRIDRGPLPDADCTIRGDYQTIRQMLLNPASAMSNFMSGRIKVSGNLALAIRFQTWFV